MKKKIIIKSDELKNRAELIIHHLPLTPVHEVLIREYKTDISSEQRGLYFKWLTERANEFGSTKEDEHRECKRRFLVPIYERDDPEYRNMMESLREVEGAAYDVIFNKIVELTSITKASVKQMSEYMTDIEKDSAVFGVALTHPEDRYYDLVIRPNEKA